MSFVQNREILGDDIASVYYAEDLVPTSYYLYYIIILLLLLKYNIETAKLVPKTKILWHIHDNSNDGWESFTPKHD